jgi:hypothetical protein
MSSPSPGDGAAEAPPNLGGARWSKITSRALEASRIGAELVFLTHKKTGERVGPFQIRLRHLVEMPFVDRKTEAPALAQAIRSACAEVRKGMLRSLRAAVTGDDWQRANCVAERLDLLDVPMFVLAEDRVLQDGAWACEVDCRQEAEKLLVAINALFFPYQERQLNQWRMSLLEAIRDEGHRA